MGEACVQWNFPLDTLDCGHVSIFGHVSESGRVQWKLPLDTSLSLYKYIYIYILMVCLANGKMFMPH